MWPFTKYEEQGENTYQLENKNYEDTYDNVDLDIPTDSTTETIQTLQRKITMLQEELADSNQLCVAFKQLKDELQQEIEMKERALNEKNFTINKLQNSMKNLINNSSLSGALNTLNKHSQKEKYTINNLLKNQVVLSLYSKNLEKYYQNIITNENKQYSLLISDINNNNKALIENKIEEMDKLKQKYQDIEKNNNEFISTLQGENDEKNKWINNLNNNILELKNQINDIEKLKENEFKLSQENKKLKKSVIKLNEDFSNQENNLQNTFQNTLNEKTRIINDLERMNQESMIKIEKYQIEERNDKDTIKQLEIKVNELNDTINTEKSSYNKKLEEKKNEINSKDVQIASFSDVIERNKVDLISNEKQINYLIKENERLQMIAKDSDIACKENNKVCLEFEKKLNETLNKIEQLQKESKLYQEQINERNRNITSLEEEKLMTESKLKKTNESVAELKKEMESKALVINDLTECNNKNINKINEYKQKINDLQEKLLDESNMAISLKNEIKSEKENYLIIEKNNTNLKNEIKNLNDDISNDKQEINELQNEIRSKKNIIFDRDNELLHVHTKLTELSINQEKEKVLLTDFTELQKKYEELENNNQKNLMTIRTLENKVKNVLSYSEDCEKEKAEEIERYEEIISHKDEEINNLTDHINDYKGMVETNKIKNEHQIQSLQTKVSSLEEERISLLKKIDDLRTNKVDEIDQITQKYNDLERINNNNMVIIDDLKYNLDRLKIYNEEVLKGKLEEAKKFNENMKINREEINTMKIIIHNLKKDIDEKQKTFSDKEITFNDKINLLQNDMKNIEKKRVLLVNEKNDILSKLQNVIRDQTSEANSNSINIKTLKEKLDNALKKSEVIETEKLDQISKYEAICSTKDQENKHLNSIIIKLNANITKIENDFNNKQQELQTFVDNERNKNVTLVNSVQILEEEKKKMIQNLRDMMKKENDINEYVISLKENLDNEFMKLEDIEMQKSNEIEKLDRILLDKDIEIKNLVNVLDNLKKHDEKLKSTASLQERDMNALLEKETIKENEKNQIISRLEDKINKYEKDKKSNENIIQELKNNVSHLVKSVEESEKINKLNIEKYENILFHKDIDNKKVISYLELLKENINNNKNITDNKENELHNKINNLEMQIKSLMDHISKLDEENNWFQNQLNPCQENTEHENKKLLKKIEDLNLSIYELTISNGILNSRCHRFARYHNADKDITELLKEDDYKFINQPETDLLRMLVNGLEELESELSDSEDEE